MTLVLFYKVLPSVTIYLPWFYIIIIKGERQGKAPVSTGESVPRVLTNSEDESV